MKKEQKTELTKERIIKAAVQEFGIKGYAGFTLNALCNEYGISKGLLYHNFGGKDELYLICVEKCLTEVTDYLKEQGGQIDLQKYMEFRFHYFSGHPLFSRILFEAVLQPPEQLKDEIKKLKREFDLFNRKVYSNAISGLVLREGVTCGDAMEYYEIMQEMFNGYFSSPAYAGKDFEFLVADHEAKLSKMIEFMLFGIAERREI